METKSGMGGEFPSEDTQVDREMTGRMRRVSEKSGEETRESSDSERQSVEKTGLIELDDDDSDPTEVSSMYVTDEVKGEKGQKEESEERDKRLEQVREIVGRLDVLGDKEGPITTDDVRALLPPETARGLERWQIDKVVYRIGRLVREKYDDRIQSANEKRGFIAGSPPSEEEQKRIEDYGIEVISIDEEYGPNRIMEEIGVYFDDPTR